MFSSSFRTKGKLEGSNPAKGSSMFSDAKWLHNWENKAREYGIDGPNVDTFKTEFVNKMKTHGVLDDDAVTEIDKYSGYILKPTKGDGGEELSINDSIPLEFNGITYQVGKNGIKLVSEKLFEDIVEEQISLEERISDITDLLLYSGDVAVAMLSHSLWKECNTKHCLPSNIRHTPDAATMGQLILLLKTEVAKVIHNIVIPEKTLEKLRNYRNKIHNNGTLDSKLINTSIPHDAPPAV